LLYDTFGDGWGNDIALSVFLNLDPTNVSYFQLLPPLCTSRLLQLCSLNGVFNLTVNSAVNVLSNVKPQTALHDWEVFWAVRYDEEYYYGGFGTVIGIRDTKQIVYLHHALNSSMAANQCENCKTPKKPIVNSKPKAMTSKKPVKDADSLDIGGGAEAGDADSLDGPNKETRPPKTESSLLPPLSNDIGYSVAKSNMSVPAPPRRPSVEFPFVLFDGSSSHKSGWFPDDEHEMVDILGFAVPLIFIYPQYYIINRPRTDVIHRGTICSNSIDDEKCFEVLPCDGEFVYRGAGWQHGSPYGPESWEFCGVKGKIGDEVIFKMVHCKCHVIELIENYQYCDGMRLLVSYVGSLLFSGISTTDISTVDQRVIENSIRNTLRADQFLTTSLTLSQDNNLILTFSAKGFSDIYGFSSLSTESFENYGDSVTFAFNSALEDGTIQQNILSGISLVQKADVNVFDRVASINLVGIQFLSYEIVSKDGDTTSGVNYAVSSPYSSQVYSIFHYSLYVVLLIAGVFAIVLGERLISKQIVKQRYDEVMPESAHASSQEEIVSNLQVISIPNEELIRPYKSKIGFNSR